MRRSRLPLLLLAAGLLAGGCSGGSSVKLVRGMVRLDGAPLGGVQVTFTPSGKEEGKANSFVARTDPDGTFEIRPGPHVAIFPGRYSVTISKSQEADRGHRGDVAALPPGGVPEPGKSPTRGNRAGQSDWAAKYGDTQKPQFTRDIGDGVNDLAPFEMTSDKPKQ